MNLNLCDKFVALSPFTVRRERFHDVLLTYSRLANHAKKEKKKTTKSGIIRRPAQNDDWF
jgi:hypothetical protein